jgi:hypothetical protein
MPYDRPNSDQRQFHRIPEDVIIEAKKIEYPMTDSGQQGVGVNISAGGICFKGLTAFKPGDLIGLEIRLAGWQRHKRSYAAVIDDDQALAPLTAVSRVAWCRERPDQEDYEIGVTFVDIYPDDYQALQKYISASQGRSAAPQKS